MRIAAFRFYPASISVGIRFFSISTLFVSLVVGPGCYNLGAFSALLATFPATLFKCQQNLVNDLVKAVHFRNGDMFAVSIAQTFILNGVPVSVSGKFFVDTPLVRLR